MARALTKNSFALEASRAPAIVTCAAGHKMRNEASHSCRKLQPHHGSGDKRAFFSVAVDLDLKRTQQKRFAFGHIA
jgi:hypothetical protein